LEVFTRAELRELSGKRRSPAVVQNAYPPADEDDSEFIVRKGTPGFIIVLANSVSKVINENNVEWMLIRTLRKLMASNAVHIII
jgi:hypothetical protein